MANKNTSMKSRSNYHHGSSVGVRTNVFGFVSLLLLIGLIATVFFAYSNAHVNLDEKFQYFSPSKFLSGLSGTNVELTKGTYDVFLEYRYFGFLIPEVYGYIVVDGSMVYSENYVVDGTFDTEEDFKNNMFKFEFGGITYTSYYEDVTDIYSGSMDIPKQKVDISGNYNLYIDGMPNINDLLEEWESVGDDTTFFHALVETARFIGNSISHSFSLIESCLPWNSVETAERIELWELWNGIPPESVFESN